MTESAPNALLIQPGITPPGYEALLRAFEQSQEGILITDARNRIAGANPAFLELSGYTLDELLGHDPRILGSGDTSEALYVEMWDALRQQGVWSGEIWNKHKNGGIYPRWLTISSVRAADGEIISYIANFVPLNASDDATSRLAHLAYHDPLTHLPNRLAFESHLTQALRLAEREAGHAALMLIDLDNFKNINDTLGHHVGDELLALVAQRLRECVRASDMVARLGGDEFVVLLPDVDGPMTAARVANKIQTALADSYTVGNHMLYATPSIGISLYPTDGQDTNTLLRNADTAMYHAKSAGRNNHQFYAARMNAAAGERLQLENALRQAIAGITPKDCEFSLHFQAQINTRTQRVCGLEALLRWRNPTFGMVSPLRFIHIAEETGLIQPLGDWVIWEACRLIRAMRDRGIAGITVAINISAHQLRHENLLLMVQGALSCYELKPADIELEVTESTAMQNPEVTLSILDQLAAMGIKLAIDDFGTGYSSLASLDQLPIDTVKIDRAFVAKMVDSSYQMALVQSTVQVADALQLAVVAEGVETEAQASALAALGCHRAQGFLYGRPMPAVELATWWREQNARADRHSADTSDELQAETG